MIQIQKQTLTMNTRMKYIAIGILTGIMYLVYKNYTKKQKPVIATETSN